MTEDPNKLITWSRAEIDERIKRYLSACRLIVTIHVNDWGSQELDVTLQSPEHKNLLTGGTTLPKPGSSSY